MRATLFVVALLACGSSKKKEDPGPTCSQVVDHMLEIMKGGLTGHGNVEMGNRQQMLDQCESRKLTPTQRKCMLAANNIATLANCSAPPKPLPTAPAGPATAPATPAAPAGSGTGS